MAKRLLAFLGMVFFPLQVCCAQAAYFSQVNLDGFGTPGNIGGLEMKTMVVFKDRLYTGVANPSEGAQVWAFDRKKWKQVNSSGFGSKANTAVSVMATHDGMLYVGTTNLNGGEVWAFDGQSWRCLHSGRFGDILSQSIKAMTVFRGKLYVGLWDQVTSSPTEVWRFDGEASWELVNQPGFGSPHNICTVALAVSAIDQREKLYALVWKSFQYTGKDSGCEIWQYDGSQWLKINSGREGFGEKGKGRRGMEPFSFAEYQGKIYVGLWAFENGVGWEVWSWDGKNWEMVNKAVLKETYGFRLCIALTVYKDRLFAAVTDAFTDFELWSYDGKRWDRVVGKKCATPAKFDDPGNKLVNAMAVFHNRLYLGVTNEKTGYEIWRDNFPEIVPRKEHMTVGERVVFTLERGALPVRWSSGDEKIAAIDPDSGYCQALSPGVTTICASDAFGFRSLLDNVEIKKGRVKTDRAVLAFSEVVPAELSSDKAFRVCIQTTIYPGKKAKGPFRVGADLSRIENGEKTLYDDGTHGDRSGGDNIFSRELEISEGLVPGRYPVRITITDRKGNKTFSEASFQIRQGYSVPKLVSVEVREGGISIPVLFDLSDPDGDECSVLVEYRNTADETEVWHPASITSKSGWIRKYRNRSRSSNKIAKLKTPMPVNHYICVWDSFKDLASVEGAYCLRLTPADKKNQGMAVVTEPVKIDNSSPPQQEMVYVEKGDFYIDKYEYPNQFGVYPTTRLTFAEARQACRDQGKDLCTPDQWETAYFGNSGKRFPYGEKYGSSARDFCNTSGSYDEAAVPSGIYRNCVNDIGAYDMGGNVYEWCVDDTGNVFMADRSYFMNPLDSSLMNVEDPTHRHTYLGHRCCKSGDKSHEEGR